VRRAIQSILLICAMVAVYGAPRHADAAAASVRSIRSSAGSDYTRIVVDLSTATRFDYAILPANPATGTPARLYVDLHGVKLVPGKDYGRWIGDTRVRRVRTGQFTASTARVVLELEGPVTPKVFQLQTPARVVIDLRGKGSTASSQAVARASKPAARPAPKPAPGPVAKVAPRPAPKPAAKPKPRPTPKPVAKPAPKPAPKPRPVVSATRGTRSSSSSRASVPRARRVRIVLDPGHGGRDPGARNSRGVAEKNTVFDVSRRLSDKLKRGLDCEIFMTRTQDKFIDLEERKDLANRIEADLFVSIHANAAKNNKLHGIETYYLKNSDDRATLRLARLENGVDLLIKGSDVSTDADLNYILSDMVQGQKEADSILLANHIQGELVGYLRPRYHSVQSLGVKQGPFMVLDGTYMPSVLVETGFITNSLEGGRMASTAYRESIAEGLYRGIKAYLEDDRVNDLR